MQSCKGTEEAKYRTCVTIRCAGEEHGGFERWDLRRTERSYAALLLRLRKIQAICSRDLSQSFEIEFGRDKRVPLMPKVLS